MNLYNFEKRMDDLDGMSRLIKERIVKLPKGNLRIVKNGRSIQYFHVTKKADTHGRYIRKNDHQKAYKLAQREYYERVLSEAERERSIVKRYVKSMGNTSPEKVYDKLSEYRKAIVTPICLSDDEYIKQWQAKEYLGNPYNPEEKIYETKRGEFVRSKSEAMIADMYYELGIPYRYECPIQLYNGKTKYPDFTLLRMPERKEIIHEHMGCLEEASYRRSNLMKIAEYSESNIYLGVNLILTFETDYLPFNRGSIRSMIIDLFVK